MTLSIPSARRSARVPKQLGERAGSRIIVFFIISGFCIHFPNRKGLAIRSWEMYFTRRYVRIFIPMTVAIALSVTLGMKFGLFSDSILWSLLCEEIYYLLYPGLLTLRDGLGWRNLLIAAWSLSLLVILTLTAS